VSNTQIGFYYKTAMADAIGDEHGITPAQFDALADKTQPLIAQINQERKDGKTPYRELPYNTETVELVRKMTARFKEGCENLVVLGIGGSALGNIALQTALNPYMYNLVGEQRKGPRLFVFDNVDPAQFASFLDWAGDTLDKIIFNVISKSGETAETASQLMIVCKLLQDKLKDKELRDQVVATTDRSNGILGKIADTNHLETLEVPDGVGGRFSVLSAVGLFSAAMCGIEIDDLLAGARDMDERVSREDFRSNPAAINAAINYHFYTHGKKNSVIMPYSNALKDMADWYRQLWAESLGKKVDLAGNEVWIGPTPIKALGATDQHSQVQLYREGPNDKLFTFLEVRDFGANLQIGPAPECAPELGYLAGKDMGTLLNNEKKATEYALLYDHRPCLTIFFDQVDAYTVGQFIYFFEVTTSLAGALFNIDTYNQPAVQLCKEATFALMGKTGECKLGGTYEQLAEDIRTKTKLDEKFLI
jgi:glucose-6-phosphate isomerase